MKLPLRLPPGWVLFWRGCRTEEKLVLGATALIVPFCLGFEYSMHQSKPALPPLFRPSPEQNGGQKNEKPRRSKGGFLLIHVTGKVKRPGLQKLPAGSRVFEAIEAAGGATDVAASNALNLAALVKDGEKIVVGALTQSPANGETTRYLASISAPAPASQPPATAKRRTLPTSPINLNTASAQELEALPGVGPAIAARIVAARQAGRFKGLSDLDRVKGIGPKKLEEIHPYATF